MNRKNLLRTLLYVGAAAAVTSVTVSWYYLGLPPKRCNVHARWLRRDVVPIVYGLLVHPKGYAEAWQTEFANANSYVSGGCVVMPNSPKTATVFYCPACRDAEQKWNDEHAWPDVSKKRDTATAGK